jgi:hypothetical protein
VGAPPRNREAAFPLSYAHGRQSQSDGQPHRDGSNLPTYASAGLDTSFAALAPWRGELGDRVAHLPALPTHVRHQDRARPVAGADEDVLGPRRRVDEVPRAQLPLPLLPSTSSRHSPATPMVSRRGLAGQTVAAGRLRGRHGGSPRSAGPPAAAGRWRQGGGVFTACPHRQGLEGQRSWPSTRPAAAPTGPPRPSTCSSRRSSRSAAASRNFANYRRQLLPHCGVTWQTHRTARLRGRSPRLVA